MALEPETKQSLDERKFEQETTFKKRELDIRQREIAMKEAELQRSRLLNPTVVGLVAAGVGLIGSVIVARVNNSNTQEVERLRSQSNLVLEAIKTGNPNAACRNLVFFVNLGLLADVKGTIANQCKSAPQEAPSLPVATSAATTAATGANLGGLQSLLTPSYAGRYFGKQVLFIAVTDRLETGEWISGAHVRVTMKDAKTKKTNVVDDLTHNEKVSVWIDSKEVLAISVSKDGFKNYDSKDAFPPLLPSENALIDALGSAITLYFGHLFADGPSHNR